MSKPGFLLLVQAVILAVVSNATKAECLLSPLSSIIPIGESVELEVKCTAGNVGELFDQVQWFKDGASVTSGMRSIIATAPTTDRSYRYIVPRNLPAGNHAYHMVGYKSGQSDLLVSTAQVMVMGSTTGSVANLAVFVSNPQGGVLAVAGPISGTCQGTGRCDYAVPGPAAGNASTLLPITITAVANSGYVFAGWSGDCTGMGACTLTMVRDKTVTATFNIQSSGTQVNPATPGCGLQSGTQISQMPTGANACSMGEPFYMVTTTLGYSWNCPGTGSGSFYCTASRARGAPGDCGTASIEKGSNVINTAAPNANLCQTTAVTPTAIAGTGVDANKYVWTCTGENTPPTNASCTAKRGYLVQASSSGGAVDSIAKTVEHGTTTSFTFTPDSGNTGSISGCGGTALSGISSSRTYTTGSIQSSCTVTGTFTSGGIIPSQDPWKGSGTSPNYWIPAGTSTHVFDQMSVNGGGSINYVPGCLNLQTATNSGAQCFTSYYDGTTVSGASASFSFNGTNTLAIRFDGLPGSNAFAQISLAGPTGSGIPNQTKIWLTQNLSETFEQAQAARPSCAINAGAGSNPSIATNAAYPYGSSCVVASGRYYLMMKTDVSCTSCRYQLTESSDLY
jgi:uncharacterized repeat protein (TIGR02543 family)